MPPKNTITKPFYVEEDAGYRTPCWKWARYIQSNGYGKYCSRVNGRQVTRYAHRWMYERLRGPIPDGMVLDHLCRNRACVNPDHMDVVTQRTNCRRGERAKYSREDIEKARKLALAMPVKEVARRLGIPMGTIYNLLR